MSEHFKIGDRVYFIKSFTVCDVIAKKKEFIQVKFENGFTAWCKRAEITKWGYGKPFNKEDK